MKECALKKPNKRSERPSQLSLATCKNLSKATTNTFPGMGTAEVRGETLLSTLVPSSQLCSLPEIVLFGLELLAYSLTTLYS